MLVSIRLTSTSTRGRKTQRWYASRFAIWALPDPAAPVTKL